MVNAQDDQITVLPPTYNEKATTEVVESSEIEESSTQSIDDRVEPTDEDLATLRRVPETIPLRAWLVVVVELCERFSFYGCKGVWGNYIKNAADDPGTPGMLGMGPQGALGLLKFFGFWAYTTPIIGGVIADQYWGRYKTIIVGCICYIVGEVILLLTSIPLKSISIQAHIGGFIASIIVIGIGTGGIKSNVSALVAEQCTGNTRYLKRIGNEQVIVDPAVTAQRIYMWFYWAINVGSLGGALTVVLEHKVGFWSSYLLPLIAFLCALMVIVVGRRRYILRKPQGSILLDCYRAGVIAAKNGWKLDAARPSRSPNVKWDDQFIEEFKRGLVACKIFLFYPIYWMTYGQMDANLTSMSSYMRDDGFPNDILTNINPLTLIIFIPVVDYILYPGLRRIGFKMRPITRIVIGFWLGAVAMAYCAIIQHLLYKSGPYYDKVDEGQKNDFSLFWQIPAFMLIAFSEIFSSISGLEYAYLKAPSSMKSLVLSVFLFMTAIGSVFDVAFVPLCKNPLFIWVFVIVCVIASLTAITFWFMFRGYNKEDDHMNDLDKTSTNLPQPQEKIGQV